MFAGWRKSAVQQEDDESCEELSSGNSSSAEDASYDSYDDVESNPVRDSTPASSTSGSGDEFPYVMIALGALFILFLGVGVGNNIKKSARKPQVISKPASLTRKPKSAPQKSQLVIKLNGATLKSVDSDGDGSASLEELISYCPQIEAEINRGVNLKVDTVQENVGPKKLCGDLLYEGRPEPANPLDRRITAVQLVDHNLLGKVSRVYDIAEDNEPGFFSRIDCAGRGYSTLRDYKNIESEFQRAVSMDPVGVMHAVRKFVPSCRHR